MVHLARFAGLPWDCILTAENARSLQAAARGLPDGRRGSSASGRPRS